MKISFPEFQFHRPVVLKEFIKKPKDSPIDAADPTMAKDREMYAIGRGNRHRVLGKWVTRTRQTGQDPRIRDLVQGMLISPAAGTVPEFKEETWATIRDFDARRQRNENCATIMGNKTFQQVRNIAADPDHPRRADAQLLADIMTRPLGENPEPLERYLSGLVSKQVRETINEAFDPDPEPDFTTPEGIRTFVNTFNGIMHGVALNSQDYTAAGRALILEGAVHLAVRGDSPAAKPDEGMEMSPNDALAMRLRQATFCFPCGKLQLDVFNTRGPDPLEKQYGMGVYLDLKTYHVMEKTNAE